MRYAEALKRSVQPCSAKGSSQRRKVDASAKAKAANGAKESSQETAARWGARELVNCRNMVAFDAERPGVRRLRNVPLNPKVR